MAELRLGRSCFDTFKRDGETGGELTAIADKPINVGGVSVGD